MTQTAKLKQGVNPEITSSVNTYSHLVKIQHADYIFGMQAAIVNIIVVHQTSTVVYMQ